MQINVEKMQSLILQEPIAVAGKALGEAGSRRVKAIMEFLRKSSRYANVDGGSNITVFSLAQADARVDARRPEHAKLYQPGVSIHGLIRQLVVEIREDGSAFLWSAIPEDIVAVVQAGIVYRLNQSVEKFNIAGTEVVVEKVVEGTDSQFFINYFTNLKDALVAYRDQMARTSKCHVLRDAWTDENRFWFKPKPEYRLRRSLCNFLYPSLRLWNDITLRPEQNVDESHPVDIKIEWRSERRTAIIEVKWVGQSFNLKTRRFTATYQDRRAREGAKQLAEYLEDHRQEDAEENTRGYLVVFDCRRNGIKPGAAVTRADAFHYANKELEFKPEYHKERDDFEEPIRMFLEPVCV